MTWNVNDPQGNESGKIRWETVPYFHGRVLDIGCGAYKCFPHWIGIDSGKQWGRATADVLIEDAKKLDLFATQTCDAVFSSHLLEHIPFEDVPAALMEWVRVIKKNGHLMLYVPDEDEYPKVGEFGANPDHKWNVNYDRVIECMEKLPYGWDCIDYQKRNEGQEYSLWFVFKILQKREHKFSWKDPKPAKTAAVIRYGAIGDNLMASSLFPVLKSQGYHVTMYCADGPGYESIKHDPNVDRFIIQGKDEIPNAALDEFWKYTKPKYEKWINLCESVEATLLVQPGRANWEWSPEIRAKYLDRNYLEWTHELAGLPGPYNPQFHSTIEEKAWARKTAEKFGKRNVLWSLSGSSGHKVWPHLDEVIAALMLTYPDVHVVLCGDDFCRILERGWQKEPRVHCVSGEWTIRESMAFAEVADIIIGTETGLLNAAGSMNATKIVTLSHSSQEMLTKHWKNVIPLEQPKGVGCSKHPCRQLHGAGGSDPWVDCPQEPTTGTALCQYHVGSDLMWQAIQSVFGVGIQFHRKAA